MTIARIGTAKSIPATPQSHPQKINDKKMATGFKVIHFPKNCGVTKLLSSAFNTRYKIGARHAYHIFSNWMREAIAIKMVPHTAPIKGMWFKIKAATPHMIELARPSKPTPTPTLTPRPRFKLSDAEHDLLTSAREKYQPGQLSL